MSKKQQNSKKHLLAILISIICIVVIAVGVVFFVKTRNNNTVTENNNTEETNNSTENEVIVTTEVEEIVRDTIQATQEGEDVSTTEEIESSEEEEQNVVDEGAMEGYSEQMDNISYDGTNTGNGLSLLGAYQGLTYYSQADSRWANLLYTSCGNTSQTMKSSACGPTSAAIIVSSSKGTILPTTMANLFVANGYRTASNGTAWAAMPFIADYFDIDKYYTTSSYSTLYSYLRQDNDNDNQSDYFAIAACGSGLWTTGGHYIAIMGDDNGRLTVYDPYLYSGKFNTSSRRAAGVVVSGNTAYVSESSFTTYSNANKFWIYSNDKGSGNTNTSSNNTSTSVNYTRYVATQSLPLNVRASAGGTVIGSVARGTAVTVTKVDGNWSYITSPKTGWVSTSYLSSLPVTSSSSSSTSSSYKTSVGSSYKLSSLTTLYKSASMSGTYYTYKANTSCKVISHYNSSIDYIYISATGRYAYVYVSAFKLTSTSTSSSSSSSVSVSTGSYATLKGTTKLYANSNMSGTYYTYIANTKLKVLSHISSTIDKVQVVKTGRVAYVYTSNYKSTSTSTTTTTTSSSSSTVGSYKTLKARTTLYANSSMSGTYYTYLAGTQVKIIKNVSSSVDYIYVTKTGRYAYCYKSAYK